MPTPHERQVKLLVDVPEPRAGRTRIVAAADGTTWDKDVSTGFLFCPVTREAIPLPYSMRADWPNSNAGPYNKLKKADYSGLTSTKWIDMPRRGTEDWYLQSTGATSEVATTTASFPANTPWHLSFYTSGVASSSEVILLECGWGVPGDPGSITLRFRSSGAVSVIVGTAPVARYDWNGGTNSVQGAVRASLLPKENRTTNLLLIPCRWRSLLVLSDGGGFEHVFGDIPLTGTQPTITPAGHFWWRVPAEAGAACVQLAPVAMEPTPNLYSRPIKLRTVPPTGTVFIPRVFWDLVGRITTPIPALTCSLVNATTLAPFVADGAADYVRVKVALDASLTPLGCHLGIHAADLVAPPTATTTASAPVDITRRCEVALSVPEGGPATIKLHALNPQKMQEEDGVKQVLTTTDRPVALKVGDIDIFRGVLHEPEHEWAQPGQWPLTLDLDGTDRDIEPTFSQYFDSYPFDKELWVDAVVRCWQDLGFSNSDLLVTNDGYRLPYNNRVSLGEWLLSQESGQTRAHWLERLRRDWAATYITGWRPTASGYKWTCLDPEGVIVGAPVMTLYESKVDATAAGVPYELLGERVIRGTGPGSGPKYRELPPVVNHLGIVGYDPRRDTYPYAYQSDVASQTPGTLPEDRPRGWRGRIHAVIKSERAVQSVQAAERMRDVIVPRAMFPRERAWWRCGLIIREPSGVPLWRGDRVTIKTQGGATRGVYRILSMNARLLANIPGVRPLWEVDYMAERTITP